MKIVNTPKQRAFFCHTPLNFLVIRQDACKNLPCLENNSLLLGISPIIKQALAGPPAAGEWRCRAVTQKGRPPSFPIGRFPSVSALWPAKKEGPLFYRKAGPLACSFLIRPWARRTGGRTCCRTPRRKWGTSFRRGSRRPPRRTLPSRACWPPARQFWPCWR